jgi:hypothetical protein
MERIKFKYYEQRPCKFIFRNGKKVFGVIWESKLFKNSIYYFATANEFKQKLKDDLKSTGFQVSLEDVIHAELLK